MNSPIPKSAPTKREALRLLLVDGAWHHMSELRKVGGWRYGARIGELKESIPGLTVEKRSAGADNEFEYRATFPTPQAELPLGPAKRPTARQRIEQLARENLQLRRRVAELEQSRYLEGASA